MVCPKRIMHKHATIFTKKNSSLFQRLFKKITTARKILFAWLVGVTLKRCTRLSIRHWHCVVLTYTLRTSFWLHQDTGWMKLIRFKRIENKMVWQKSYYISVFTPFPLVCCWATYHNISSDFAFLSICSLCRVSKHHFTRDSTQF